MATTSLEMAQIRDYIGATPDDGTVEQVFALRETVAATAMSILRQRRADLVAAPAQWTSADYSEQWGKNLEALDRAIAEVHADVIADAWDHDPTVVRPVDLVLSDADRLFG